MKQFYKAMGLSSLLVAPLAFGAGFQLNEFSITEMGRAQAGGAVAADNAASIARNPAILGSLDSRSLSIAAHYINPDIDVKGTNTTTGVAVPGPTVINAPTSADASSKDVAPTAMIPGLYYAAPVNEKASFGLSVNSHFGLSTDYGSNYAASEFAQETSIKTIYLTPSIAYKVIDSLTLGVGISYVHGEGVIKNTSSAQLAEQAENLNTLTTKTPPFAALLDDFPTIPEGTTLLDLEGDGEGWGYQLGLVWDITENHHLGFRYESRINLDLEGDIVRFGMTDDKGTLTAKLPEVYELSYHGKLSEGWSIFAGIQKTGWSSFDNLTAKTDNNGTILLKEENWNDAWRYSVAAEYDFGEAAAIRFGLAQDESPVEDEFRTLTIPDADRQWISLGATFNIAGSASIDIAYLHISGDTVEVEEEFVAGGQTLTTFSGELTSTSADIFTVGYNYSF